MTTLTQHYGYDSIPSIIELGRDELDRIMEFDNDSRMDGDFDDIIEQMSFTSGECSGSDCDSDSFHSGKSIVSKQYGSVVFSDLSDIITNVHFKMYYNPLRADYRHIYSALFFDSLNSSNFPVLRKLAPRIFDENMLFAASKVSTNSDGQAYLDGEMSIDHRPPHVLVEMFYTLTVLVPDITIYPHKYKMYQLSHIPSTFANIPLKFFNDENIEYLNAHLLDLAAYQNVPAKPGCVIIGTYHGQGTPMTDDIAKFKIPIVNNRGVISVRIYKQYIFVFDDFGKICRMEMYSMAPINGQHCECGR